MTALPPTPDTALPPLLAWRRLRWVLLVGFGLSLPLLASWVGSYAVLLARLLIAGLVLLLVFGGLERWPARLPRWIERWALQVLGVALAVPIAMIVAYLCTSFGYETSFSHDYKRMAGFGMLLGATLLVAPWVAMLGLLRQVTGEARNHALAFQLERSQLERQALDARMRVLQSQVEPHFLFNTLANVRELVDSGSPQASIVLGHLIAYLRAAMPRLQGPAATLENEVGLVRAYLELMQMRMPDRLQFVLHVDQGALSLPFPGMALLTLVENAVRHGIDPSEEGGRIEVRVGVEGGRCRAQVLDTGIGPRRAPDAADAGTGLANLRERLKLIYGERAAVRLEPVSPHGASAELEFPLLQSTRPEPKP